MRIMEVLFLFSEESEGRDSPTEAYMLKMLNKKALKVMAVLIRSKICEVHESNS